MKFRRLLDIISIIFFYYIFRNPCCLAFSTMIGAFGLLFSEIAKKLRKKSLNNIANIFSHLAIGLIVIGGFYTIKFLLK